MIQNNGIVLNIKQKPSKSLTQNIGLVNIQKNVKFVDSSIKEQDDNLEDEKDDIINTNKVKFKKMNTSLYVNKSSLEEIEKLLLMSENTKEAQNLNMIYQRRKSKIQQKSLKLLKDDIESKNDDEEFFSENSMDEEEAERIVLKNREIKVKRKTIKKMNFLMKKTQSLMNPKFSENEELNSKKKSNKNLMEINEEENKENVFSFSPKKENKENNEINEELNIKIECEENEFEISNKKDSTKSLNQSKYNVENSEDEKLEYNCSKASIESPDKIILQNLINEYYQDIKENVTGNYEEYVVNNITIVSYLETLLKKNFTSPKELSLEDQEKLKSFDNNMKVLFLDLDETLIHSDLNSQYEHSDAEITLKLENGSESKFSILIRPFTNEFLQFASERFNLVLFTAGTKSYADPIVDYIDPYNEFFKLRLYRCSCTQYESFFIKDLNILERYNPNFGYKNSIILDNCIFSFANNLQNGILISSFYFDHSDKELLNVADYLEDKIMNSDDIMKVCEGFFGFNTIKNFMFDKLSKEGVINS